MPRSRRALLAALAGGTVALAGCGGRPPAADPDETAAPTGTHTATTGAPTDDATPLVAGRGPVRGEADPVSVERTVTDPDLTYLSEQHAVEYVAAYRHVGTPGDGPPTREPVYETMPFERWGRTECASVAADVVADHLDARTDGSPSVGFGTAPAGDGLAATVNLTTTLDRDGDVVFTPDASFHPTVAATPRAVTATVVLSGESHTETVPVWVRELVQQQE
jgi:hypothetical protein